MQGKTIDTRDWRMGYYPMPARPPQNDDDLIEQARLFNHGALAERLISLTGRCVCNVGVQVCPEHPGRVRLKTQEEKIAFRKQWDARVDEGR